MKFFLKAGVAAILIPLCFSAVASTAQAEVYNTAKEKVQDDPATPAPPPPKAEEKPVAKDAGKKKYYAPKPVQQAAPVKPEMSSQDRVVSIHLTDIARKCPGKWEAQMCLSALSNSVMSLASQYAQSLDEGGHGDSLSALKEHCAAATAATKIEVPAYAMNSALTECANTIYDLSNSTGVKPHLAHYQLLVSSILCLNGDKQCMNVEQQLIAIRSQ